MSKLRPILALSLLGVLAGCKTAPEPLPEPIVVEAPVPILTCAPVATLQKIIIPAETKVQFYSTGIDNGEYADIESARLERTIVTKPAQILYVNSEGREVFDICENVPTGATGPGIGEVIEGDG